MALLLLLIAAGCGAPTPVPDVAESVLDFDGVPARALAEHLAGIERLTPAIDENVLEGPVFAAATCTPSRYRRVVAAVLRCQGFEIVSDATTLSARKVADPVGPGPIVVHQLDDGEIRVDCGGATAPALIPVDDLDPVRAGKPVGTPSTVVVTAVAAQAFFERGFDDHIQSHSHGDAAGSIHGFRLVRIRSTDVLGVVGLRNGDVVRAINGVPTPDAAKANEVLRKLPGTGTVTVELRRRNAPFTLTITVE